MPKRLISVTAFHKEVFLALTEIRAQIALHIVNKTLIRLKIIVLKILKRALLKLLDWIAKVFLAILKLFGREKQLDA